jgi:hypothetical protein
MCSEKEGIRYFESGSNRLKLMIGNRRGTAISKELPSVKSAPINHKWLLTFMFTPAVPSDASRGIKVIEDLSHQSRKLGAYRALIIGINDYKDPKISDVDDMWYTVRFDFVPR